MMADHKTPDHVTELHLLLWYVTQRLRVPEHKLLDLFHAAQLFMRTHDERTVSRHLQNQMKRFPLAVIDDDYEWRVTDHGRDWAKVLRLSPDGTFHLFGHTVTREAWSTFIDALRVFITGLDALEEKITHYLTDSHTTPTRVRDLRKGANELIALPSFPVSRLAFTIYQEIAVIACRDAILHLRKREDLLHLRARDMQVLDGVQRELELLQSILDLPNLANAHAIHKPRVTDFVNVGVIEESLHGRATDEKFGILAAPTLFTPDFAEAAEGAFSRNRSFAVAFIDIDKFKDFNTEYHEVVVDRDMLPHFMRNLEAYCYGRAYAYRQGGDEYLVLLHNANHAEAKSFFEGLQAHLAEIEYPESIPRRPTVSIGVHVIDGNHEITVFEAKKLANQAKDTAKHAGRNCVRFSTDAPPADNGDTSLL